MLRIESYLRSKATISLKRSKRLRLQEKTEELKRDASQQITKDGDYLLQSFHPHPDGTSIHTLN